MEVVEVRRLKAPEEGNRQLKQMYADLSLNSFFAEYLLKVDRDVVVSIRKAKYRIPIMRWRSSCVRGFATACECLLTYVDQKIKIDSSRGSKLLPPSPFNRAVPSTAVLTEINSYDLTALV